MGYILAGYNPWGHKESEMTEQLNNNASIAPYAKVRYISHSSPKKQNQQDVHERERERERVCVCVREREREEGFLRNWPIQLYMQLWRSPE